MFTVSNIVKRGSNYLFMIVLARTASLETFGLLSAYINVLGVVLLFTNFGFSEYLLVNSETNEKLIRNSNFFLNSSLLLVLVFLIISLVVPVSSGILLFGLIIKLYFENILTTILLSYYQVKDRVKIITYLNFLNSFFMVIICLLFYTLKLNVYSYLLAFAIIYVITFGLLLKKDLKLKLISPQRTINFLRQELKKIRYYGFSMITIPAYMMIPNLIGAIFCSIEDFAVYQVAFSITSIILLISSSLLQSDYPKFLKTANIKELGFLLTKSALKILGLNALIILVFTLAGKEILLLIYQKEIFVNAFIPLILLLISNSVFMFATILAVVMVIKKEQRLKTRYHVEYIIISLVLSLILIYCYNIYGIVYTYVLLYTYVLIRYLNRFLTIKKIHI